VHPHEPFARNRQQAERVVLTQVGFLGERQAGEVVERADVLGRLDAGRQQPLAQDRRGLEDAADQGLEPLELQRAQLVAREPLDRLAQSVRCLAFQLRSRFSTSAGLRWQYACSRQYMAM
jgi:hypothetical protein